jgi:phytoene dehydrogenase-like protein
VTDGYDAIVVGAGPNGLAAAIAIAREGRSVLVIEAAETIGGGTRTQELTLEGYRHDVCSAVHPLALASPFLRDLGLAAHGLEFVEPPLPLAHPLDDGTAVALHRSIAETADQLGADGPAYARLLTPLARDWEDLVADLLGPLHRARHVQQGARFGVVALRSARSLAASRFRGERARALLAGNAAHSMLPLEARGTAAFGLLLQLLGHAVGWPIPIGGSSSITDAMARLLRSLGGEIETGREVRSLAELPRARAVLLDLTPRQILRVAGERLPDRYRRALGRYRYGPGVFKVDFALSGPVPWAADECRRAGTVHVGGSIDEIAESELAAARGGPSCRPFVLTAQQSLFDAGRAPDGCHTLWSYCHVAPGSSTDMTAAIEAQIERFAPGFRDRILARHTMGPAAMERHNANYVGGDINGGVGDIRQLIARPALRSDPYSTPNPGIFICSSATPPGGGVHGMCGWWAARSALRGVLRGDAVSR